VGTSQVFPIEDRLLLFLNKTIALLLPLPPLLHTNR
jgi:hypothetical protein